MFSSWPDAAFVAGVNTGAGSRLPRRRPRGSGVPPRPPVAVYSFHAEPARYPRTTHSMSIRRSFRTIIDRPSSSARRSRRDRGNAFTSAVMKWVGIIRATRSNQKADSPVSTRPLSGIPVGNTTSNADRRSVAMINS